MATYPIRYVSEPGVVLRKAEAPPAPATEPTYPLQYTADPGVVLLKAAKAPPKAVQPAAETRQHPLAAQARVYPLQGKV